MIRRVPAAGRERMDASFARAHGWTLLTRRPIHRLTVPPTAPFALVDDLDSFVCTSRSRLCADCHDDGSFGISKLVLYSIEQLREILNLAQPISVVRYVVFHCADPMDESGNRYYESIDLEDAGSRDSEKARRFVSVNLAVEWWGPYGPHV